MRLTPDWFPFLSSDFARLGVSADFVAALNARGITTPTPIQAATLPDSLAGRDVLGRGRTGSGKSFAFLLPMVQQLRASGRRQAKKPRALILAPTRELALQLHESLVPLEKVAGLNSTVVFGGVNQNPQARALAAGVDIVIACPGRLLDLIGQRLVDLSQVRITVIDEADHMADMGFLPDVRRILATTPTDGQRMLFSATLDAGVNTLVKQFLHSPVVHEADSELSPITEMDHHVLRVDTDSRTAVLADLAAAPGHTIIFTRTKHGAKKLAKQLIGMGIPTVDLHGNLSQNARTRNMDAFHSGKVSTLVATDIAARGIHVDDVSLVVHADPPTEHKAYLHRSGRTARAGNAGTVITMELPSQRGEVRTLLRQAKINATSTVASTGAPILTSLAPGQRTFLSPAEAAEKSGVQPKQEQGPRRTSTGGNSGGRNRSRGGSAGRNGSSSGQSRSGGSGGRNGSSSGQGRSGGSASGRATAGAARAGTTSAADFSRNYRRSR